MVLEVDLDDFVRKAEHDGVPSTHPLLNVDAARFVVRRGGIGIGIVAVNRGTVVTRRIVLLGVLVGSGLLRCARFQVTLEMLEQGHLLLQLLGELGELILGQHVLLLALTNRLALVVEEAGALLLRHDLRRVIEEHAGRVIAQQVAQAVLRAVVDPLGNPDGVRTRLRQLLLLSLLLGRQMRLVGILKDLLWMSYVRGWSLQLDYIGCIDSIGRIAA